MNNWNMRNVNLYISLIWFHVTISSIIQAWAKSLSTRSCFWKSNTSLTSFMLCSKFPHVLPETNQNSWPLNGGQQKEKTVKIFSSTDTTYKAYVRMAGRWISFHSAIENLGICLHQDAYGITKRIMQIEFTIRIQLPWEKRLRSWLIFITMSI